MKAFFVKLQKLGKNLLPRKPKSLGLHEEIIALMAEMHMQTHKNVTSI